MTNFVAWCLRQPEENLTIYSSPSSKSNSYDFILQLYCILQYPIACLPAGIFYPDYKESSMEPHNSYPSLRKPAQQSWPDSTKVDGKR